MLLLNDLFYQNSYPAGTWLACNKASFQHSTRGIVFI